MRKNLFGLTDRSRSEAGTVRRIGTLVAFALTVLALLAPAPRAEACCPAPPSGKPVVNADQTVIIVWDAEKKTQHFIRRASFQSEADDFGFLVPTPSQPELAESGNDAFPFLQKLTEPEVIKRRAPAAESAGCCGSASKSAVDATALSVTPVRVLDEKTVAGFDAVVLEATSAEALVGWLKARGYAFSPEIEAWAKPYIDGGWKITALKVAKDKAAADQARVAASSLRLTFQTDRPLFPYREPDSAASAAALGVSDRLLRIYFVSDSRYDGELTKELRWTGRVEWAGKLDAEKSGRLFELLALGAPPAGHWYLTEFEDRWPYRVAPADLYFAKSPKQTDVRREPIIEYVYAPPAREVSYGLGVIALLLLARRARRGGSSCAAS
jgi:hypothetical protein